MFKQISLVIADDHRLFRKGLRLILLREETIKIVGEAASRLQTIDVIRTLRPDVALLDLTSPEMGGIEVIPPIRKESPKTKPLILSSTRDEAMILNAVKAGAKGHLSKDTSVSDLIKAIHAVHRGDLWVERKLIAKLVEGDAISDFKPELVDRKTKEQLTPREQEVLRCLTKGWTNKEIAQALFISDKTVKSHLNTIFRKLSVTRRLQAILYAINRGLK